MATAEKIKNQLSNETKQDKFPIKTIFNSEAVQEKFKEVLGSKTPSFISSVLNVVNNDKLLSKASPNSVINSAMIAATLDLPIDKNLGYAWIVPYKGEAQFQMGYKGFIQLAQRTGQYKAINVIPVYEGELVEFDRLSEEIELDYESKASNSVIGYCGYFKLLNGFEKTVYWPKEKIDEHKKRYSKAGNSGPWSTNYDAMAMKTVLKNMLSKWGILSIEMQQAVISDERKIKEIDESGAIDAEDLIDVTGSADLASQSDELIE